MTCRKKWPNNRDQKLPVKSGLATTEVQDIWLRVRDHLNDAQETIISSVKGEARMGHDSWLSYFRYWFEVFHWLLPSTSGCYCQYLDLCSWLPVITAGTQAFSAGCQDLPY